jgi:hypothetical protein
VTPRQDREEGQNIAGQNRKGLARRREGGENEFRNFFLRVLLMSETLHNASPRRSNRSSGRSTKRGCTGDCTSHVHSTRVRVREGIGWIVRSRWMRKGRGQVSTQQLRYISLRPYCTMMQDIPPLRSTSSPPPHVDAGLDLVTNG